MATKFHTFTGESTIEALKKAQETCGEKAILVTTKQIQAKTINKKPLYEILVSVEEDDVKQHPKPNAKAINYENAYSKFSKNYEPPKPKFEIKEEPAKFEAKTASPEPYDPNESVLLNISAAAKEISTIANVNIDDVKDKESSIPSGMNKKIDDVAKQVSVLSEKIGLITDMIWDEKAPNRNNLSIPPEFASIYKLAKQSGMKEEHLEAIMQTTLENLPISMKSNPTAVKRYFYSLLRNMLPCRKELNDKKQRIMMLVGPTGVGKTTTLAKLAARFAYGNEKRYKTGIITLDTYRIGAVEQLFQYAKMMKLPILDVIEIDDFQNAIKQLNYCDVILIDTTGNSQYDVNLVLSAGSKVEDLIEIYNGFSFLDIDTLIITKFDETKIFGNVFSLIYETNTPVSYFSVGQEVPDDLVEAKSEFLVECVFDGFTKQKASDE